MPEIALCRNCTACADPTDAELELIDQARMWDILRRNADELLAVALQEKWIARKLGRAAAARTKELFKAQ
jgi:hypothetical protein